MSISIKKLDVAAEVHAEIQEYKKENNGARPGSFEVLSSIPEGLQHFSFLLNETHNPLATASYGGGVHATEARHIAKYDLWGKRILDNNHLACFFVFEDDAPIGFINLGLTGNTVTDNKHGEEVIEFGAFFADSTFNIHSTDINDHRTISDAATALAGYIKDEMQKGSFGKYSSIMSTFSKDHPWASRYLPEVMTLVTKDNHEEIFGKEPFNAQRFQFNDNNSLEECNHWNPEGICDSWTEKDMYVLGFYGQTLDQE
ncbi:MAG: hypothetical protein KBC27_03805 [Rickettsiales bacterium]|nr:hypothetical protein [Rickettsiales bacterium]